MRSKVLLRDTSPCCNTNAVVEETESCVYFYLTDNPIGKEPNLRTCWVRNYGPAPLELDEAGMKEGKPPMMPKEFCSHPEGAQKLDPSSLEIVWLEEGDGAALLYMDEILCVVPGWAGTYKYPGHARDCIKPHRLAVPLGTPDENILHARVKLAMEFWSSWNEDVWKKFQSVFLNSIERDVCKHSCYYKSGSEKMPKKSMVRLEMDDVTYFITIGASVLPQPSIELYSPATIEYIRRFELGLAIKTEMLKKNENEILMFLGDIVSMPWYGYMWLGNGHTLPCPPIWSGKTEFQFVTLLKNAGGCPDIRLPQVGGDNINLLWIVPLTETERKSAQDSGMEKLLSNAKNIETIGIFDGNSKFEIK